MSRLPVCSGADAAQAFRRVGNEVDHQTGSHITLRHPSQRRLTVPNHRELAKDFACSDPRGRIDEATVHRLASMKFAPVLPLVSKAEGRGRKPEVGGQEPLSKTTNGIQRQGIARLVAATKVAERRAIG